MVEICAILFDFLPQMTYETFSRTMREEVNIVFHPDARGLAPYHLPRRSFHHQYGVDGCQGRFQSQVPWSTVPPRSR